MKNKFYFSHDGNARNDDKLIAVRMRFGAEGYGIYFMIIERLLDSSEYMSVKDYNIIAFDLRVSADKVKSIVEDFGLFQFTEDGKLFYSESFINRMKPLDDIREKRREAGIESAKKRARERVSEQNPTSVEHVLPQNPTSVEVLIPQKPTKESKVKESKEEETKEKKNQAPLFDAHIDDKSAIDISLVKQKFKMPDDPGLKVAFSDFIEMRKAIKKPMTDKAKELMLKALERFAPDNIQVQITILNRSIANSWSDVYPLKNENNGTKEFYERRRISEPKKHAEGYGKL